MEVAERELARAARLWRDVILFASGYAQKITFHHLSDPAGKQVPLKIGGLESVNP
jgi:hypothetical protein